MGNKLLRLTEERYKEKQRIVAPLVGFPGVNMIGSNIKIAQQNYGEHYKVLKKVVDEFTPDIIFPLMDLSVEANALGRYTLFPREDSATVRKDKFSIDELKELEEINISFDSRVNCYVDTVKLMRIGLPESILKGAYVTGPYSLAGLIMGADDAAMATIMDEKVLTQLCNFTTEVIEKYTGMLISAGAEVICILEPTAVMLGPSQFEKYSARYVKHINDSFRFTGVITIYHTCGNTMHLVDKMVLSGVDGVSLDSREMGVSLKDVALKVKGQVAVMGNINPSSTILHGKPQQVEEEVGELLDEMETFPNFILSTGCDLPQETPYENIKAFMETGRKYRVKS
jgi:uroporphyrinogen decarboxylase